MYLKSLEIQGFKSFPDKTKLEFGSGLTAVVGPNGSGKSNIGDAVRWVLGEQSSKTLRGAKMEDVIFSGTQARKSVGFAQVTLNIDNGTHELNIDSDDVSVSRKLYRSGDSEYMINGSQVRLKDVVELFMDTGLGRDGYSIIGQGRVAEIVSAKSNERREIFEEAAGISKFRYKKAEAERRLSAAEENLLRLRDILGELEGRVEPLRKQSESAKKFLSLSESKKSLELSIWNGRLEEYKKNLSSIEERILSGQGEYDALDAEIERIDSDIEQSYRLMQESAMRAEKLRTDIIADERRSGEIKAEIAVMQNDISHAKENIAALEKQRADSESGYSDIDLKMAAEQEKIAEIEKRRVDVARELSDSVGRFDKIIADSDSFSREYEDMNAELSRLYIKRSELTAAISNAEELSREAEEQISAGKEQESAVSEEISRIEKELAETESGLSGIAEVIEEHNNRISGLNRLHLARAEKLEARRKEYDASLMSLKEKQQRISLLTDLENSMEGFAHSVKSVIKAGRQGRISGIRGTVAQLIKVEDRYSVAVETALGAALQNVVVENEDIAKRCIKLLKESNSGRATFLPMTSVKGGTLTENGLQNEAGFVALGSELVDFEEEYSGIIKSLLGRIAIAEDIDMATMIAKRHGYKFRIVTLDGQVINAGGSFTGGSATRSAGVLTRKNEIDRLSAEVEKLSSDSQRLLSDVERLKAETDKLHFDIEGAKEELSQASADRIMFEAEMKRLSSAKEQTENQLESIIAGILRLRDRVNAQNEIAAASRAELTSAVSATADLEQKLEGIRGRQNDIKALREELSEKLSALKIRDAELSKDKETAAAELLRLEESRKSLLDSALDIQKRIDEQNGIISDKTEAIGLKEQESADIAAHTEKLRDGISDEQIISREQEKSATELRSLQRAKSEQREKISADITRHQERSASVQRDYDAIISELWEQYGLSRSEAAELAAPPENPILATKELNEIKQSIKALGNVNVAAIEEYKEVSERYAFMSKQISDVETSKRELTELISELTDSMRKMFSESFEQINENFKAIFVELFGGGRAELVLTTPEDVLESGIEINVAPPGKVIKSLSLLSGGEQAFVAIAIYFAILKIRPAPFCILDEIEAALDDVNVGKYAAYLRNFTATTQFILITHRRGTMEEADVLYGVTMQDKGISKLIKLDQNSFPDTEPQ